MRIDSAIFEGGMPALRRRSSSAVVAAVVVFAAASKAFSADQAAIDAAIKKGLERLFADQKSDGSWHYADSDLQRVPDRSIGLTALAALALHENGIQPSDRRLQKAIKFLRAKSAANSDAYSVACATMFLGRLNQREDRELVRSLANKLMAGQGTTGCWHYDVPRSVDVSSGLAAAPTGSELGDLSVTQFATIALWQAQNSGAAIGGALVRTRARLAWGQTSNGGFNYAAIKDLPFHSRAPEVPPANSPDSASMSTAGAFIWVVAVAYDVAEAKRRGSTRTRSELITASSPMYAELQKGTPDRKTKLGYGAPGNNEGQLNYRYPIVLPPPIDPLAADPLGSDQALQRAMKRVDEWAKSMLSGGSAYYLWTIARLGVLLGQDKFGGLDWYQTGAESLIARQKEDGSWDSSRTVYQPGPETCFALLFLSRVNLGSDISRLLGRNPPQPFTVVNASRSSHSSLEAALAAAKDGDIIEVSGYGPYKLSPMRINKSVSIRCARGSEPILAHAGPEGQPMLTVEANTVAFEGIRFQVDTPTPAREPGQRYVPKPTGEWLLFDCMGRNLRFLNCSFTAQGRTPAVGLRLTKAARVFLRNCLLGGFGPTLRRPADGAACGVMLKDCIAHGTKIVEAAGENEFNCWLLESSFTAGELFDCGKLTGGLSVTAENNVVKAEKLFGSLNPGGEKTWTGQLNLVEVKSWVAAGSESAKQIYDMAAWRKFWQTPDKGSNAGSAPFENAKRAPGPVRHDVAPTDWSLDPLAVSRVMRLRSKDSLGANIQFVGAGMPYHYFRDTPDYANWQRVKLPSER